MNIGIFDSGLGGLSIFKKIIAELPRYNYIYLGDNARVPYGNRSSELIYEFTKNAVGFLMKQNCHLVILACNAATSSALRRIQQEYLPNHYPKKRVLGVIRPVVEIAVANHYKKKGVIGARVTIHVGGYQKKFKKLFPKNIVYQTACPLLVPIIEEGKLNWKGLDLILKEYLTPLKRKGIRSLILGCTHYGLIADKIQKILGQNIEIISQGETTTGKLKNYLLRHPEIESKLGKNSLRKYYVTDLNKQYKKLAKFFLGGDFTKKDHLNLVQI